MATLATTKATCRWEGADRGDRSRLSFRGGSQAPI